LERESTTIGAARTYRAGPDLTPTRTVLALLAVTLFVSLIAVPIGWWAAGWVGALAGIGLGVLVFLLLDALTVREVRLYPDGWIELRSRIRTKRVDGNRIEEIAGELDRDEGVYSFSARIGSKWHALPFDTGPGIRMFVADLELVNPGIRTTGEWPGNDQNEPG
jgi:hypothetical protein